MYNGVPGWLLEDFEPTLPYPLPFGWSLKSCPSDWMWNCVTEAAAQAYQDLYDNKTYGMRDAFVEFWKKTSKLWAGNTNIIGYIGYELINEPFAGNVWADPELLLPGIAGSRNLQPFYHALAEAIRENDDQHLIFYEPVTWGMILPGGVTGSGFSEVPGGSSYKDRSVLSYHYYCSMFGDDKNLCDDLMGPMIMSSVVADVEKLGGSTFMTEFGYCPSVEQCIATMETADKYLQSWTYWGKICTPESKDCTTTSFQ